MEYTAACRFCGQFRTVIGGDDLNEDELTELAVMECDCDEAQAYQKIIKKRDYAQDNIKILFKGDGEALTKALTYLTEPLATQAITKVNVTTIRGIRATMTAKEDTIKIDRVVTDKQSLES